jgi:hypothetical protein
MKVLKSEKQELIKANDFFCIHFYYQSIFKMYLFLVQSEGQFQTLSDINSKLRCLRFIYSKKATKFCEIFTLLLTGTT